MFFIFGISSKERQIEFMQTIVCSNCGAYGRFEIFMTYTYFSLFFIPIIKWNKKYYVRSTCCEILYTIDNDLGKGIERGQVDSINEKDLYPINIDQNVKISCSNCDYILNSDYEYCPKCGKKI